MIENFKIEIGLEYQSQDSNLFHSPYFFNDIKRKIFIFNKLNKRLINSNICLVLHLHD